MADSFGDTIQSLPPWVLPAAVVGIVLLLALRSNNSSSNSVGGVTTFTPVPADPNLTALAAGDTQAKLGAFQALTSLVGTQDVSNIAASRDVTIAGYNAETQRQTTQAALNAALAADAVQHDLGIATVNSQLASVLNANATQRDISLAQLAAETEQQRIAAQTQTTVAGIQQNTTKAVSKNNLFGTIISGIGSLFGGFHI